MKIKIKMINVVRACTRSLAEDLLEYYHDDGVEDDEDDDDGVYAILFCNG